MYEKIEKVKHGKMDPSEILQSLSIQKDRDTLTNTNISKSPAKPVKSVQLPEKKPR